jgi:RecT family
MAIPATEAMQIVPKEVPDQYRIQVKDFTASGEKSEFMVPVPNTLTAEQASVVLRAAVLKNSTWKLQPFPFVLHAVMYADRMGLDIMAGDVYAGPDGRLATTSGAKIRHAMNSGRIEGYEVEITDGAEIVIPWKSQKGEDCSYKGPNLKAKVTIYVKGFQKPITYEATLKEWYVGTNPNWRNRPGYMLRRNALSKALEEVAPMGIEAEEAPPTQEKPNE